MNTQKNKLKLLLFFLCSCCIIILFLLKLLNKPVLNVFILLISIFSIYKSVIRIRNYYTVSKSLSSASDNLKERLISSSERKKDFNTYRIISLLIWIAFIICCIIGFILKLNSAFYVACTFFLYGLDIVFYSRFCLINKIIKPFIKTKLYCCYTCPIRGWDLLMLNLPLVFTFQDEYILVIIMVILNLLLSIYALCLWEKNKYVLISPYANHNKCMRTCGSEYTDKRKCLRKW